MTPLRLGSLALVAQLVLSAASCPRVERPYPPPTSAALLAALAARAAAVRTIRAETRMDHRTEQGKVRATVNLMASRGGKLRFDAMTPFDTPLATLVSDGQKFALLDAQKNRHYHGPASPCNIGRLIQVVLAADDVLTILGGSTPVIAHSKARLEWDAAEGAEVLSLEGSGLSQTIRLDGTDRRWDLLLSEIRDRKGQVLLRVEASAYRRDGSLRAPQRLRVAQPARHAELDVTFKRQEINLTLPAVAFDLPAAGGLPSQRVDCDTELKP